MRAVVSNEKKSTKDLIREAAFSFYTKPHFDQFSMSELAARVGITKPAIYRHFKSRDEVVAEMKNYFFELIGNKLAEIYEAEKNASCQDAHRLFRDLISFFVENPQYINYAVSQFSSNDNFEIELRSIILAKKIPEERIGYISLAGKKVDDEVILEYSKSLFYSATLLFFIKIRQNVISSTGAESPVDDFTERLIGLAVKGFAGTVEKDSVLYPAEIDEKRMAYLEKLSQLDSVEFPEEHKVLQAIARVIIKYKINGVTVERIADELNMAKSSLYFYFENKNQMVASLVNKEMQLLMTICQENTAEARTYSECMFVSMMTELNFFLKRPSLLPICGWLLQTTSDDACMPEGHDEFEIPWEARIQQAANGIDLTFGLEGRTISFWSGLLPVVLIVMKEKHGFNREQTVKALKDMFAFVQYGAEPDSKMSK